MAEDGHLHVYYGLIATYRDLTLAPSVWCRGNVQPKTRAESDSAGMRSDLVRLRCWLQPSA